MPLGKRRSRDNLDDLFEDRTEKKPRRKRGRLSQGLQMVIAFVVTFAAALACSWLFVVPALRAEPASAEGEVPTADYSQPTAREAYIPALELARDTDVRAQLMSVAGIWTPPVEGVQLATGRNGWTYFFYMPGTDEMVTIIVGQDRTAAVAATESWETPPDLFDDARWRADSPAAAELLVETCTTALDETPDAYAELRLSTAEANRSVLWKGRVFATEGGEPLCEVTVDAVTGLVR